MVEFHAPDKFPDSLAYVRSRLCTGDCSVEIHKLLRKGLKQKFCVFISKISGVHSTLYPCSTKTREVLGNPSPTPERFPEARKISRERSPREILRVEGNLEGGGDGFPNTSRVLVEYGHSLIIKLSAGSGSANPSLQTGKD